MGKNKMIIAQNVAYSLDCHETQLNNNVLVVGTSGSGNQYLRLGKLLMG